MAVVIRNYNPEKDYEPLKSLLEEAGLYDEDYERQESLERWLAIQPDSIIVATIHERLVGSIYFQDGIIPHIFRLAVLEEFRQQGIGTQLLTEAEDRAKSLGHDFIELFIAPGHPELIDWYGKRGYEGRAQYTDMYKKLS